MTDQARRRASAIARTDERLEYFACEWTRAGVDWDGCADLRRAHATDIVDAVEAIMHPQADQNEEREDIARTFAERFFNLAATTARETWRGES